MREVNVKQASYGGVNPRRVFLASVDTHGQPCRASERFLLVEHALWRSPATSVVSSGAGTINVAVLPLRCLDIGSSLGSAPLRNQVFVVCKLLQKVRKWKCSRPFHGFQNPHRTTVTCTSEREGPRSASITDQSSMLRPSHFADTAQPRSFLNPLPILSSPLWTCARFVVNTLLDVEFCSASSAAQLKFWICLACHDCQRCWLSCICFVSFVCMLHA